MRNHPRISELLVQTQGYSDKWPPVILTSGELGIYYVNTEKLVQDGGAFEQYGESSKEMIAHALKMMWIHPTFEEVINILSENADKILCNDRLPKLISGGQRRDWLFSGPVAYKLNVPYASLYKDGKMELLGPAGGPFTPFSFDEVKVLHISDLLTEGSSSYRVEDGEERGWIPTLRNMGTEVSDLFCVVTRLQGGEKRLAEQGVGVHSFVAIDEDFLRQYSKNPERALNY